MITLILMEAFNCEASADAVASIFGPAKHLQLIRLVLRLSDISAI